MSTRSTSIERSNSSRGRARSGLPAPARRATPRALRAGAHVTFDRGARLRLCRAQCRERRARAGRCAGALACPRARSERTYSRPPAGRRPDGRRDRCAVAAGTSSATRACGAWICRRSSPVRGASAITRKPAGAGARRHACEGPRRPGGGTEERTGAPGVPGRRPASFLRRDLSPRSASLRRGERRRMPRRACVRPRQSPARTGSRSPSRARRPRRPARSRGSSAGRPRASARPSRPAAAHVDSVRQAHERMQSGRDAAHTGIGQLARHGRDQRVTSRAVAPARTGAGGGHRPPSREVARARAGRASRCRGRRTPSPCTTASRQRCRHDQPAKPQAGRERLASSCRDTRLDRARAPAARRAAPVVAELGVVVVLDHDAPPSRAQRAARARRSGESTTPVGHWWAGVASTTGAARRATTSSPCSSTRAPANVDPGIGEHRAVRRQAWILDGDRARAAGEAGRGRAARGPASHRAQTTIASGSATTPRTRRRYARAPGGAPARRAGRGSRTRRSARRAGRRASRAARRARERREVGCAREEVELRRSARRRGAAGAAAASPRRRRTWRRPGGREIPLGEQLRIGLDDEPARDAEIAGERTRGGIRSPAARVPSRTSWRKRSSSCARRLPPRRRTSSSGP